MKRIGMLLLTLMAMPSAAFGAGLEKTKKPCLKQSSTLTQCIRKTVRPTNYLLLVMQAHTAGFTYLM
jgi:hypothetical protein